MTCSMTSRALIPPKARASSTKTATSLRGDRDGLARPRRGRRGVLLTEGAGRRWPAPLALAPLGGRRRRLGGDPLTDPTDRSPARRPAGPIPRAPTAAGDRG